MTTVDLAEALTREHHEIDGGVEKFLQSVTDGGPDTTPLVTSLEALRRHIYLEEEFLFPPIRQAGMMMPILVMLREHGRLWKLMDLIDSELGKREYDVEVLRTTCEELLTQLEQHNLKEEPIIYPRAMVDLTAQARDTFAQYLRTGSMPPGWVCEGAGRSAP